VPLKVAAGDRIAATVKVVGTSVTVELRNLTTGKSFTKTLQMASPDVGSAEWIAEAPSALTPGGTRILQLADFGTVRFTSASATSTNGHTGSIADAAWSATRVDLVADAGDPGGPGFGPFAPSSGGVETVASALRTGGSSFSVAWTEAG
jgi:Peptidase A4 family